MQSDVDALLAFLHASSVVVSALSMYATELNSGTLKPHKLLHSERFWKDHAKQFESNDFR
jgi:hypothetical protein